MYTIELRLQNLPGEAWRDELIVALSRLDPAATVQPSSTLLSRDSITHKSIDPAVLVAIISGSATVIGALIPQLISIFKKKHETEVMKVVIVIHGTRDSAAISNGELNQSAEIIDSVLTRIGAPTGIEIRPEK